MLRRPRFPTCLFAVLAVIAAGRASAEVVVGRGARSAVALTIYAEQDLALVRETRTAALPRGEETLRFDDVPARLDPTTVTLAATDDSGSLTVLEQSYLNDLSSPQALVERWVGRPVELVEADERLRTRVTAATLLGTAGGNTYRIGDRIAVGHPGWLLLPPGEEIFTRPTLRWRVDNAGTSPRPLALSYATGGLSWSANYVLALGPDDGPADLRAWATLVNQSGARFDDAAVTLLAGQINRAAPKAMPMASFAGRAMDMAAAPAPPPPPEPEAFGELYRYAFDRRTSLGENETKQLPLLAARAVAVQRRYELRGEGWWYQQPVRDRDRRVPVAVLVTIANTTQNQLGRDLPAGTVRAYQTDGAGAQLLVGEDTLRQTAVGETVTLALGQAADVIATRTQTDWRKVEVEPFQAESAWTVTLRNEKQTPVTVAVRDRLDGDWQIVESDPPARKEDAQTLAVDVPVPAGGAATLRYRVRVGR
jgi:hypothetical protein